MDPNPTPTNPFEAGIDGGGSLTVAALLDRLEQLFFLPGDWLLWALATHASPLAELLGLSVADYGGVFSGFFSALAWIALVIGGSIGWAAIRDFDDALTRRIADAYDHARRRARIGLTLLAYRLRRRPESKADARVVEYSEELDLSDPELRVLDAYGALEPGYALAARDVAAALKCGRHEVQRALTRLRQLHLLGSTLGGHDGEPAYTLTPAGRAYLLFRRMTQPAHRQGVRPAAPGAG